MMRALIAWPIAFLFASLAVVAYVNGDSLNDWVKEQAIGVNEQEKPGSLVGATEDEKWFVVLIDFPDRSESSSCDQDRAATLLDSGAEDYYQQGVHPTGNIEIYYHNEIIPTDNPMSDYGHDVNGETDVGQNGVNPHTLAEEIVLKIKDDVEWEMFDLNDDGWVDRFLLLHCVKPQEDGSGSNSRIWSHFSAIENIVELPDGLKIAYYTIASQHTSNNFGTIIHEMYHQFGAADLYPVEDSTVSQSWKGVGKWDIMASGNWNGNGAFPALPTAATSELIGAPRHQEMNLEWLPGEDCYGPEVILTGISEGGQSLKIPIGDEEYIWVEYRSDFGYDSSLPGHGLLVLQQDLGVGNVEENLVNSHPDRPWLKVIEADGNQDMVSGANEGEQSDVFWDQDSFGSSGIEIRNRDGILVDWLAEVHANESVVKVAFSSEDCGHVSNFNFDDYSSVLTKDDSIKFTGDCEGAQYDLESTDGREVIVLDNEIKFNSEGVVGVIGLITGQINCDEGTPIDLQHRFEILGNIPIETDMSFNIPVSQNSIIQVPIDTRGDSKQTWLVGIDGALSRIADTSNAQTLSQKSYIEIEINPDGLLQEGMLIRGQLILATESGEKYYFDIELTATDKEEKSFDSFIEPAIIIPIALLLISIWVVLGIESPTREVSTEIQELPDSTFDGDDPIFVDPFSEPYR